MFRNSFILFAFVILLFSACKDDVPFENITYTCECGSTNWDGVSYPLTDAHWVTTDSDTNEIGFPIITGKDYYTTAKVELEDEPEELYAHHYNMKISIPDLTEGVEAFIGAPLFFYAHPDSNSVEFLIEEVNFNSLAQVTDYQVLAGDFTLTQGENEIDEISYNLQIYPTINGSASGASFTCIGNIISIKEEL